MMPPPITALSGTGRRDRGSSTRSRIELAPTTVRASAESSSKLPSRHRPRYRPVPRPTTIWTTTAAAARRPNAGQSIASGWKS